jgi:triacylglycerol lipase
MEKTQLLVFANIAAITYEDPKTAKTKFKAIGHTIVEFFDIDNAQAYLLKNNDGIHVLSFRGTEVTEPSDILADLKAGKNIEAIGGKIHVGFKGEINKLWPAIEKAVANIDSLYVTGHSLGGSIDADISSKKDKFLSFNPGYTIGQKTRRKHSKRFIEQRVILFLF